VSKADQSAVKFDVFFKPTRLFTAATLFFVLLLAGFMPAGANEAVGLLVPQSAAVSEKYGQGLLWRIEHAGEKASYLFGTYHSEDPRVLKLPPIVRQAFDDSDTLTLEIDLGSETREAARDLMFYQDSRTLQAAVGDALYKATFDLLITYNLPVDFIEKLKPWAAFMIINIPIPETGVFLDYKLYLEAQAQAKPVLHLESPDEQLAALDDLPMAQQKRLLRYALDNYPLLDQQMQDVTQAYLARDLRLLIELHEKHTPRNEPVFATLMNHMHKQRNHRMLPRIEALLEYGNAFIAVGALHLAGDNGLLNQLEKRGYKLTRVY